MTTWYVRGETGNNSASGTSPTAPLKSLPADNSVANGDTIYCAEKIRASNDAAVTAAYTKRLNILQWEGMPQADIRADFVYPNSGWSAATNAWSRTHGAGLTINAVTWKWDESIDASGRHYGHLVAESDVADVTGATGDIGRYNYNSTTGVMTVYLGGANPNGSLYRVTVVNNVQANAISFTGQNGSIVRGLYFSLYAIPVSEGNFGWAVSFDNHKNWLVDGCVARDCGAHAFGAVGSAGSVTGGQFRNCQAWGLRPAGSHYVFYQAAAFGSLAGSADGCVSHLYRWLGTDGNTLEDLATDAKQAFNGHSDGGTTLGNIMWNNCRYVEYEAGDLAVSFTNVAAPSDALDWNTFSVRLDNCTFENMAQLRHGDSIAFRRCRLLLPQAGPSQLNGSGGYIQFTGSGSKVVMEACEIIANTTDAGNECLGITPLGSVQLALINTSVWDSGTTAGRYRFNFGANVGTLYMRGCIVDGRTASGLLYDDESATLDIIDNRYRNISTGQWSFVETRDAQAEFLATVDTSGGVLSAVPYTSSTTNTDLRLNAAASVLRRGTTLIVPDYGINGSYGGSFGAWQYPRPPQFVYGTVGKVAPRVFGRARMGGTR